MTRSNQNVNLVLQVLWKLSSKDARARELVQSLGRGKEVDVHFSSYDEDFICTALLEELAFSGLDSDLEPTDRGIAIETAIDWVRSRSK